MFRNAAQEAAKVAGHSAVQEAARVPGYLDGISVKNSLRKRIQKAGFTLLGIKRVRELMLTGLHMKHVKTGAEWLHVHRQDRNNVFGIGFKTNPPDDTGVPHVLEHTTLCGSEKYPIRDPFFKMLPRTLSNFMNAFTASDHTFYPFATTNVQDFKNLLSVYFDATLKPLLKETDFAQEGWRIAPNDPLSLAEKGPDATPDDRKLVFKGVVYNEMKGQMSDAGYLYYTRFHDHIFPDIHNSGGDPQKITDLTYEDLKKFHREHYHPSNAKIFTYGSFSLQEHLDYVSRQLSLFEPKQGEMENRRPIDLSGGPREITIQGPVDPLVDAGRQHKTSVSWVLGNTSNHVLSFSLALISALLTDGYGSPLYKGLIESGLGLDWAPNTGYDSSHVLGIFSVGLTGVQEADVPKVKTELQRLLREVREKGFAREKIDGYLHQLELGLKHKTANFGMILLQRLMPRWFNGVHPFALLQWNATIKAFEAEMSKGGYLERLMDTYLLNDNTLTFTMSPSPTFDQEVAQEEADRLRAKLEEVESQAGDKKAARKVLEERENALLAEQSKTKTEDLSCLPSVHVSDIPLKKKEPFLNEKQRPGTWWYNAPTNGLTYVRTIRLMEDLPAELRGYIPLFCDVIMRLGTKDMTTEQLEDLIKLKTGGISVGYYAGAQHLQSANKPCEGIMLTGMALDRNVPNMFNLLHKLIIETDFDSQGAVQQIRQLLQASADGAVNDIASSGHEYARRAAEAHVSLSSSLTEQTAGLSQVKLITSLARRPESQLPEEVICKLKEIRRRFLLAKAEETRSFVTCDSESVHANMDLLDGFLGGLPKTPVAGEPFFVETPNKAVPPPQSPDHQGSSSTQDFYPLPYQVYYGALSLPMVPWDDADCPPMQILAQLLTHKYLHHEVREKGGAYGAGAYAAPMRGAFGMYSYRDPSPARTLGLARAAGRWAADREWADRDLEEAKVSLFQALDAPLAADEEGMDLFVHRLGRDARQRQREALLACTAAAVRGAAEKYLAGPLEGRGGSAVVLGKRDGWVDGSWVVRDMGVVGGDGDGNGDGDAAGADASAAAASPAS